MKKIQAFTLLETLIALVIGVISVAAITYAYIYFNNTYQGIVDKAAMSQSGRFALKTISKDLRNTGYQSIHYSASSDAIIEKKDNFSMSGDRLRLWFNTTSQDRHEVQYYLKRDTLSNTINLVKDVIENPGKGNERKLYCDRLDTQKNCEPLVIVNNASDFQVVLRDKQGKELNPVGYSSTTEKTNQSQVHTAEIYITVRSQNEILKTNRKFKITNHAGLTGRDFTKEDKYLRETFFISVYLRNVAKI